MFKVLKIISLILLLSACANKQPRISKSATILIKTPAIKFYDKGFISTYDTYTHLQIFQTGNVVLDLKVYENRVCSSTFKCLSNAQFNDKFLNSSYKKNFFKNLLDKKDKNIIFRDKNNRILIKIKKD